MSEKSSASISSVMVSRCVCEGHVSWSRTVIVLSTGRETWALARAAIAARRETRRVRRPVAIALSVSSLQCRSDGWA